MTPYSFFSLYRGIHLHFTSSYDVLKYAGKAKSVISRDKFENRRDKGLFHTWSKKFDSTDKALRFCVFNSLESNDWIYKDHDDAEQSFLKHELYYNQITKNVEKEYGYIRQLQIDKGFKFQQLVTKTPSGNQPPLLQIYLQDGISSEFIVLLDSSYSFIDTWRGDYVNDPLVSETTFKLAKYKPFVKILRNG